MKTVLIFFYCLFAPLLSTAQQAETPNVEKVVQEIDELYRSSSSYAEVEMEIVTPHWQRTLRMKVWTQGMKRTFIRILAPAKEKGVGTLRIGNEMWNYLPKTNKVIKIPPSMMMSSWMGSDFTNDDLVREFTWLDDYNYSFVRPDDAKEDLIYIELIPKKDRPIVWGRVLLAARRSDYIPVWEHYFDEKGKLMRVINFKDIKTLDGRTLPTIMELIPQDEKGNKTVLKYLDADFDASIPDHIFTLRNLRSPEVQ